MPSRQVMTAFIQLADRTTGRKELILGSCQIAAMVGDQKVPAALFDLPLSTMFEKPDLVQEALAAAESEQERLMRRWPCVCLKKQSKKKTSFE